MRTIALLASVTNVGFALAIAAVAIGATFRIRLLVHQKNQIFPKHD